MAKGGLTTAGFANNTYDFSFLCIDGNVVERVGIRGLPKEPWGPAPKLNGEILNL